MSASASPHYRWVVLAVSVLVNVTIQLQWIALAPVSATASGFYGVSTTLIGWFSIAFMVVFIPLSIPAAWLVDHYGIRFAVGLGAVLVALGGSVRALAGPSYGWALAATVLVAAAQPLMLNAWTTVAGRWFPRDRRALVVSVLTLASMAGVALGTALSPALLDAGLALDQVLWVYAGAATVTAIAYCVLARDADRGIADASDAKALELTGLWHALRQRPFEVFLAALFVALGVFNGLSTWSLQVVTAIGLPGSAAELLLEALLLGGVLGALVLGAASDRSGRRVAWTAVPMILAAPLMMGFVVPHESVVALGACAFVAGFLLTGAMPVGMQYASEIAAPTPEGASSGLFQLCGQVSFVVVIFMDAARTGGSFWLSFGLLGALLAIIGVWLARQPEPVLDATTPGGQRAPAR